MCAWSFSVVFQRCSALCAPYACSSDSARNNVGAGSDGGVPETCAVFGSTASVAALAPTGGCYNERITTADAGTNCRACNGNACGQVGLTELNLAYLVPNAGTAIDDHFRIAASPSTCAYTET